MRLQLGSGRGCVELVKDVAACTQIWGGLNDEVETNRHLQQSRTAKTFARGARPTTRIA
jgi:hypothetical protein